MRSKKTPKDKRMLSLLGSTALFGYLGCQFPGAGPTDPAVGAPKDTTGIVAKDSTGIVSMDTAGVVTKDTSKTITLKPDPTPQTDSLIVRNGPTLGEACPPVPEWGKAVCSIEGVILSCQRGVMLESFISPERYCNKGDTVLHFRHFGFTGIEKAGARRGRVRMVRANPAWV